MARLFFALAAFVVLPLALGAAGRYEDQSYEDWLRKQSNYFAGGTRPRDMIVWETYQFRALSEQLTLKQGSAYRDTLRLDDRIDVPGKVVNHYRGHFLISKKGELDYFFRGDEIWFYYYPRIFPGTLLVFRDEASDGLIVKGDDKDGRLDGVGVIDAVGRYHEIWADYYPETKNYEFTLPDGRLAKANLNWYRKAVEDTVRANINGYKRWFDFDEVLPGGLEKNWALDVGTHPRTGVDERQLRAEIR